MQPRQQMAESLFCGLAEDILSAVSASSDAPVGAILSCVSQQQAGRIDHGF